MKKRSIKSDLKKVDAIEDKNIDYSEIPEVDEAFLRTVEVKVSPAKKPIALRLDEDVLEWMKAQGKGYQSRINTILRAYYEAHKDGSENKAL